MFSIISKIVYKGEQIKQDIMSEFVEYTDPEWRNLNMRALRVDECYIILNSFYDKFAHIYTLSDECYKCPFGKTKTLQPNVFNKSSDIETLTLNTAHAQSLRLYDKDVGRYAFANDTSYLCELDRYVIKEFGVYNLTLNQNGTCTFVTDKDGVDVNWSLLSVFVLVFSTFAVLKLTMYAWRKYRFDEEAAAAAEMVVVQSNESIATVKKRERMTSLDAFRGMAIVLMIFVNSGGGAYWWMEHAPWNGLHFADIVFPSFLWIMGVCIPISVKSQLGRGAMKFQICKKIAWRSIKLFAIGLFLNSINGPQLENLRLMGVLQRFGIAYMVCGVVHTIFAKGNVIMPQTGWKHHMFDLILFKSEFLVMLVLIIVHLSIIFGLNVPNCPKGYLGPGGKHEEAAYANCIGGATGYIDMQILGNSHIYQHPTAKFIYDSKAFDPEGVFGSLLTVVQVFFGVLAGVTIVTHNNWRSRTKRWICWSLILGLLGGALCTFSQENGPIPINKNLWSLSFVLITSALAFIVLTVLYVVIDVNCWWSGSPFVESGMNAIIMYVGHTIMHKMLPWHWRVGAMNTHFILLLEAVWNTSLWIGIALYLHSKKIYYSL